MMFSPAMAQEAQTTATTAQAGVPKDLTAEKMMQDNLLILGLLFFIFYFMLIRPQQKRVRAHQTMLKSLQKGTKVITNGGLIGSVVKFEGDEVAVIEVAQGVRVRVAKAAIAEVAGDKVAAGDIANDN
jgi:preprotein translocase subunit YajC